MFTFTFFSTSCSLSLSFPLHVLLNQCQLQINGWSPIFWLVASSFVLWSSQLHAPHFISIIFHQHCHQHHNSSAGKHVSLPSTSIKGLIKFTLIFRFSLIKVPIQYPKKWMPNFRTCARFQSIPMSPPSRFISGSIKIFSRHYRQKLTFSRHFGKNTFSTSPKLSIATRIWNSQLFSFPNLVHKNCPDLIAPRGV